VDASYGFDRFDTYDFKMGKGTVIRGFEQVSLQPYTLHPTPYTLHPKPCSPNPRSYALTPTPWTPKPET
jgi:hypothetical protein